MLYQLEKRFKGVVRSILFILLFLLQGSSGYVLLIISTLFVMLFVVKFKDFLPLYFLLLVVGYLPYLFLGMLNSSISNIHIDVKYQVFAFLFLVVLLGIKKSEIISNLFKINVLVFVIFGLLYFDLIPNFWHESTIGAAGRMYGPSINVMLFVLFYYIIENRKLNGNMIFALLISFVYILMTSNFMNLTLLIGLTLLLMIDYTSRFQIFVFLFLGGIVVYILGDFLPDIVFQKASYLTNPWEYGSVLTRISDLSQAISNSRFTWATFIFGEGFGVTTTVFRINELNPSLSQYYTYLEIDNGFYYLFHRGGMSLLLMFFLVHIYLAKLLPNSKSRLAFLLIVVVTNLLSIHYFTHWFNLLYAFLIIEKFGCRDIIGRLRIKFLLNPY